MSKVIMVTGGSRSGKSVIAEQCSLSCDSDSSR